MLHDSQRVQKRKIGVKMKQKNNRKMCENRNNRRGNKTIENVGNNTVQHSCTPDLLSIPHSNLCINYFSFDSKDLLSF